jgi:hypothetical protein
MGGECGIGWLAFCDTARGGKLGHHTRYVVGVDVQTGLAVEPMLYVSPVAFCISEFGIIGDTNNEFPTHSQSSSFSTQRRIPLRDCAL